MSSSVKGLIAGIAALVLIGGGLLAMKLTEPKPEGTDDTSLSSSAEGETSLEIYSGNYNDIKTLTVTNENGGYTVKRTYKAPDTNVSKDTSGSGEGAAATDTSKFTVEGLENIKLDESVLGNFPQSASSLTAQKLIEENCGDLSRFGLDKPRAEAVIAFDGEDPENVTLLIGNDTPAGDIYVCLKGENTVYSAASSFIKTYTYEKEYFVSRVLIDEPDEENYPIVQNIKIERADLDYDIVFEYSGEQSGGTTATHVMTSPVNSYLNVSSSVDYTHGLFGLKAASVLSVSPTEQELAFSGIGEPLCVVTMTIEDGSEYVLRIGKQYNGDDEVTGYMGYLDGTDILWKFDSDAVPWVTMKPEDAMSSLVFGSYIYDLSAMKIETESKTLSFAFEGDDADNYKVKLDGKDFDVSRYKSFYQALIKAPAEEICMTDENAGRKIASVKLSYNNGNEDELIEFFEADDKKAIIKKNGEVCFKCRMSFLEKSLLPNIKNIEGDTDFVTNW